MRKFRKILAFRRKGSEDGRQTHNILDTSEALESRSSQSLPLDTIEGQAASHRTSIPDLERRTPIRSSDSQGSSQNVVNQRDREVESGTLGLNVVYTPNHGHKADIVFIHGLGGTSRWTWSKNKDPELFWPLTFLALEPDLCLARILTFGYNATLRKAGVARQSVLDFAKDLLFDLKYAKDQRKEDLNMGSVS